MVTDRRYKINGVIRHLYVHTPFCAKICPYCAFYVHQGGVAVQREFVAALRTEWRRAKEEFPLAPDTIYFGGGTPSILSAELFAELAEELKSSSGPFRSTESVEGSMVAVDRRATVGESPTGEGTVARRSTATTEKRHDGHRPPLQAEGTTANTGVPPRANGIKIHEFTLEVNPATVTDKKAAAWRAAGVNRISLGAQSFDAEMLKLLGRQHTPEDIAETCTRLRVHGFDNINLDLMFGLPGQSESTWIETLQAALGCGPQHVSAYGLTYEEDTPFFEKLQQGVWKQDEPREIAMFLQTREILGAAGLVDYEISNFSKPGLESQHNLAYWRGHDYLGLGPSACSTLGPTRWRNVPNTQAYIERIRQGKSLREEMETLDASTRIKERIMFGLRTREGVATEEFHALDRSRSLQDLKAQELVLEQNGHVRLTAQGQLVADSVAAMFV